MGALCWLLRPHYRHGNVRRIRAVKGTAKEIRIRTGQSSAVREGNVGPVVTAMEKAALERAAAAAPALLEKGRSYPLGAALAPGGANFCVFSRTAESMELLLFDRVDDGRPARVIPISPD